MLQYLYAIREDGHGCIKIGVTKNPEFRIAALRASNPFKLNYAGIAVGGTITERYLHDLFSEHRLEGEWFWPSEPVTEFVDKLSPYDSFLDGLPIVALDLGEAEIGRLYDDNWSLSEIGDKFGISRQAVQQIMIRMGKPRRPRAKACQARNVTPKLIVRLPSEVS